MSYWEWIVLTNFAVLSGGIMTALIGFFLSLNTIKKGRNKLFFVIFFAILTLYVVAAWITNLSTDFMKEGFADLSRVALFFESLFSSILIPLLLSYILFCAGQNPIKNFVFYIVLALWVVYLVILIIAQFGESIYYFSSDNVYHRGTWYSILLVPPILLMLVELITLLKLRKALTRKQVKAFLIYLIVPLCCMIGQMIFYGLLLIVFGTTAAALLMLMFIILEQTEQSIKQAKENARLSSENTVLKMRPHFIYNTMMSIYYLIEQDTEKAQKITFDFTSYLRKNFTAIAKEGTIPFSEELEHTRAYLAVEQIRFENSLFVEFDTPHTRFRIPPLTLQPIVENAVKHGVDPELDPLYVSVITRKTKNGSEITVEDTGPGFGVNDNNEPHIALANITERLGMMCKGTLTISERKNGGTKVTVYIPD